MIHTLIFILFQIAYERSDCILATGAVEFFFSIDFNEKILSTLVFTEVRERKHCTRVMTRGAVLRLFL